MDEPGESYQLKKEKRSSDAEAAAATRAANATRHRWDVSPRLFAQTRRPSLFLSIKQTSSVIFIETWPVPVDPGASGEDVWLWMILIRRLRSDPLR